MLDLLDYFRRKRASASYSQQEIGNLIDGIRAAVRKQEHTCVLVRIAHFSTAALAEYSCTYAASAFTFSTGVSGKMPWPKLKMCPGRPAARSRISWAQSFTFFQAENSTTGSRFPCTAPSLPSFDHPSSSGTRQSSPITSAPVSFMDVSSVAVSVPK